MNGLVKQLQDAVEKLIQILRDSGDSPETTSAIAALNKLTATVAALVDRADENTGLGKVGGILGRARIITALTNIITGLVGVLNGDLAGLILVSSKAPNVGLAPFPELLSAFLACLQRRLGEELPKLDNALTISIGSFVSGFSCEFNYLTKIGIYRISFCKANVLVIFSCRL